MSLKNLIKVANYYDVKYGLVKKSSVELAESDIEFEKDLSKDIINVTVDGKLNNKNFKLEGEIGVSFSEEEDFDPDYGSSAYVKRSYDDGNVKWKYLTLEDASGKVSVEKHDEIVDVDDNFNEHDLDVLNNYHYEILEKVFSKNNKDIIESMVNDFEYDFGSEDDSTEGRSSFEKMHRPDYPRKI